MIELFDAVVDSVKIVADHEKVISFMASGWWQIVCAMAGLLGVYLQILRRAVVAVGDTTEAFKIYHKSHRNTIMISIVTYAIIIGIWYAQGLEIIGMEPFKLTLMTIFIGYQSQDFFDGYAAKFTDNKKTDGEKP